MTESTDLFLCLSSTAWTALSAIGTLAAVAVALGLPILQSILRRKNLESVVLRELAIARQVLVDVTTHRPRESSLPGELSPQALAMLKCQTLEIGAWVRHRETMAELSFSRFKFYDTAFEFIGKVQERGVDFVESKGAMHDVNFTLDLARRTLSFIENPPRGVNLKLKKWIE